MKNWISTDTNLLGKTGKKMVGEDVFLYYTENLDLYELDIIDTKLEAIWTEVKLHSRRISLSVIYRPPKDQNFFDTFSEELEKIWLQKKNILIIGDLKADVVWYYSEQEEDKNVAGKRLLNIMDSFGLKNVIKQPTRVIAITKTLLDISIVSDTSKTLKSGVFDTCIADHRLNYTVLKLSKTRVPPKTREVINWKECNQLKFKEETSLVPWHVCNVFNDIDDNYWMVETLYKNVSQEFLPNRKAKLCARSLPWMNGEIRRLMNKRYKQLKKAQQTKDPKEYDKYKILRNKLNIELKRAELQYWKQLLKSKDKGSKNFWKVIKKMTGRERKDKRMGPLIDSNNKLVHDDNEKAETMNKFFSTTGQELSSNFRTLDHAANIPNINMYGYTHF